MFIRFCLIDCIKDIFDLFNIKVEKGYVLMRNGKDLVGTRALEFRTPLFPEYERNEKKRKQNRTKSVKYENEIQRNEMKSVK
jgi:hypothetical protein